MPFGICGARKEEIEKEAYYGTRASSPKYTPPESEEGSIFQKSYDLAPYSEIVSLKVAL